MSSKYVMGFTDHERRRLALQGQMLNPLTEAFLERAGLCAGMHVLDLGSGIGDVALLAAKLVGPGGSVTGIDQDGRSLEIARSRAAYAGSRTSASRRPTSNTNAANAGTTPRSGATS